MKRDALWWLGIAAPLIIVMAIVIPNADGLMAAWKLTEPLGWRFPLERLRMFPGIMKGQREAKQDIHAGHLQLIRGFTENTSPFDEDALRTHLGVTIKSETSCMGSSEEVARCVAYDEWMMREITRRFGAKALADAYADANAKARAVAGARYFARPTP